MTYAHVIQLYLAPGWDDESPPVSALYDHSSVVGVSLDLNKARLMAYEFMIRDGLKIIPSKEYPDTFTWGNWAIEIMSYSMDDLHL